MASFSRLGRAMFLGLVLLLMVTITACEDPVGANDGENGDPTGAPIEDPIDDPTGDENGQEIVVIEGTGAITIDTELSGDLSKAIILGDYDDEADVWVYDIFLYGGDIELQENSLSGSGSLVRIDIDEYQDHEEPQSESYEFGGASAVTSTRGSFVELGVAVGVTLSGYQGGDEIFSAEETDDYAYHIFDDSPSFDNISPSSLDAGFTGGGPSEGGTLSISFDTTGGSSWNIEFSFGETNGGGE